MPAPTTIDEFLDLVRKSGVVEDKRLDAYLTRLRAGNTPPTVPAQFAGLLVRDGVLTHFQAEQVLLGKWRRFTIGKYKVLERLGAGGMGSVYLCEHKLMRRRVAVKVLPTAKADDPSSLERFYREARAVAALDHPNIVRAYDIDQDDKLHFLVMEYVDGSSLQEIIKKVGPMDVTRAAHYMLQSALGLQHAHASAGLVHRDIKPGNILVDRSGVVKILDMGLARFFHDEEDILTKKYDENVLGTADYLAPEQALDSHGVDIRADIYSLGATFYFCLTGRTPFTEGTVAQKLIWHQTRQPKPIRQTRPEVPDALAVLIERMMAKDPAQRPQTPQQVADALAPFTQSPIAPPPEEEMPRLSPAALGQPGGEGPVTSAPTTAPGPPSSGQRKSWQVPSTPGNRPPSSTGSPPRPASNAGPAPPSPAPPKPRPNPPTPSGRATAIPVKAPQVQRAPSAPPAPAPAEEEEPWERLAPDTEELAAQSDTPPQRRKSSTPPRRVGGSRSGTTLDTRRVIIIVAVVAALLVGGLAAGVLWLLSSENTQIPPAEKPARPPLRVGKGKYPTVRQAITASVPGDRIVVEGPDHAEALVIGEKEALLKNLTIEAEGEPVIWRTPKGMKEPISVLIVLRGEGLKLRNFKFDGDNRCNTGIQLNGRCPGTTLEDLTLQGFLRSGLTFLNCDGENGRPVAITRVKLITAAEKEKAANAAIEFSLDPVDRDANHFLSFSDLTLEGAFKEPVHNRQMAKDDVTGLP
jgi:serine/threonine protein kinase